MVYNPEEIPRGSSSMFEDMAGDIWVPMYRHDCTFGPEVFHTKMMNIIKNPNINSSWLFRADITYDDKQGAQIGEADHDATPQVHEFNDIARQRVLVRVLVPRNTKRDAPLSQTCTLHQSRDCEGTIRSLIIYIPHVKSPDEVPFYHPKVQGIAHYHEWNPGTATGSISVHFLPFPNDTLQDKKVQRTAYHLLQILYKHGSAGDYVKRVHHDLVIPQARLQDRFTLLKHKYARPLIDSWAEVTDPEKHVFEDLAIASFLIELWLDMYRDSASFPGFVDIGCGNGLLVYILNREGFPGWGFDARSRTSWKQYTTKVSSSPSGDSLEQRLLLPDMIPRSAEEPTMIDLPEKGVHSGVFPAGTFIVSNHADELTPWTPILAASSRSPFIMIPCCSHNLSGGKFRAPPPRDKAKSQSTYASLVDWVTQIAEDCGWRVESEMLRIPSTRNTALIGRTRKEDAAEAFDAQSILHKYGGASDFRKTVMGLLKGGPRGH